MTQAALLLLPDGGVKLLTERTRVSDIMKDHPGFAVGSFTSNREVLPAEKLLRSGSSYYLHRVTNSNGSSDLGNADDGSFSGFPRTRSYASAPSIRGDTPSPEHPSQDLRQASQSHPQSHNFRDFAGSLNFVRSSTMSRRASLAIDTSTRGISEAPTPHRQQRQPRQRCKHEQQTYRYDAISPKSPATPRVPSVIGASTPSFSSSSSISPSPLQLSPRGATSELLSPRYQDFAAWSSSTASSSNGDLPRVHSETTLRSHITSSNHPSWEAGNVGDFAATPAAPVRQSGVQGRILKWKIREDTTATAKGGRLSTCAEDLMATRLLLAGSYGNNNSRASISGVPPLHMRNGF